VPQVVVRRRQALWHSCATVETDYPLGETAGRSVEAGGIQTGRGRAYFDEVSQDLEHLRGVGAVARPRIDDDGDDLHGAVTASATERVRVVDLLDQPCPCGAALLGRDGQLAWRLFGGTYMSGGDAGGAA
jgi:hypothetical protein